MNPAYHMHFSTRDMARLGHLMLNRGNWNGEQIIPRDWARPDRQRGDPPRGDEPGRSTRWVFRLRLHVVGLGRAEGVGPFEGAYTARGAIGQWITVFPALDLVLAHKTNSVYGRTTSWESYERLIELLFDAKGVLDGGALPLEVDYQAGDPEAAPQPAGTSSLCRSPPDPDHR